MKRLDKKTIIVIFVIIVFIIGIYYFFMRDEEYIESNSDFNILNTSEEDTKEEEVENKISETEDKEKIIIYITGAVQNEGVYELDENSRIADSIEKAGGLTEEADIKNLNLAYVLEDGMKIYVPKKSDNINEIEDNTDTYVSKENSNASDSKNTSSSTQNSKININTATQAELETLPGIGPSIAMKIINYHRKLFFIDIFSISIVAQHQKKCKLFFIHSLFAAGSPAAASA